ncbi:MAG TPA: Asp-tRNA(Asn)/Glu-tRNA(Gln) amidotransferase subunit GatB [Bacillota bacterium]|nr:Asp-tRNA(Asn)/Glu-tRNA(Gln) amidotransferase subunit GatB [Bacillota bacterium]
MPLSDYEIVIGLEVHSELKTESKVFCGCPTKFGAEPNTHVCPVCLGLPGVLPVLNEKAVEYTICAGLALHCDISSYSKFDRKQYFYPDLPKAYQISQYDDFPFCKNGWIEIEGDPEVAGGVRKIRINRVHLEEEAGKSVHSGTGILDSDYSMQDYNRCGIPLIEIVGEPDLRSPREAKTFLEKLKTLLLYTGISDCKMEEGSLRCDANISLRPWGRKEYGIRAEIKNMNSFRAVEAALQYEAERQAKLLDKGEKMFDQTRTWDENKGVTVFMRSKEGASDYRYFPEPDLVPVITAEERVSQLRLRLPEMPEQRQKRYTEQWGLPEYDAGLICGSRELADFFETAVAGYGEAKTVSNWVMVELLRLLNQERLEITEVKIRPEQLVKMLKMIDAGTINGKIAKIVFEEIFMTGKEPEQVVAEKGLVQISDTGELENMARKVLDNNPQSTADYIAGKEQAFKFLVGQMMKETKGRANPALVNELLKKELDKRK